MTFVRADRFILQGFVKEKFAQQFQGFYDGLILTQCYLNLRLNSVGCENRMTSFVLQKNVQRLLLTQM